MDIIGFHDFVKLLMVCFSFAVRKRVAYTGNRIPQIMITPLAKDVSIYGAIVAIKSDNPVSPPMHKGKAFNVVE